jgi:hypothetical protein
LKSAVRSDVAFLESGFWEAPSASVGYWRQSDYRPEAPVAAQALLREAPYFRSPLVCALLAQGNGFERHLAMKNLSNFQLIQL